MSEYFHADSDGTRRLLKVKESFKSPRYNKYTHFSVAEFMKYVKEENINLEEFDEEEIFIEFGTNVSPCLIKSVENNDYVYMILPIRLKGE